VEFVKGKHLRVQTRLFWYAVLVVLAAESNAISSPNDSTGINSTTIIRLQMQSIADEVIDSAKFDVKGRVAVLVEGEGQRPLAENAFVEALQKRQYASVVIDTVSVHQILRVYLYNSEINVREVESKLSQRNIRTMLEARIEKGAEHETRMLGTFLRETKDTVQTVMAESLPAVQKIDDGSILQRMLTPFIVVGGAIVIVYLFFMVRS
jgi:hypothetical protein